MSIYILQIICIPLIFMLSPFLFGFHSLKLQKMRIKLTLRITFLTVISNFKFHVKIVLHNLCPDFVISVVKSNPMPEIKVACSLLVHE